MRISHLNYLDEDARLGGGGEAPPRRNKNNKTFHLRHTGKSRMNGRMRELWMDKTYLGWNEGKVDLNKLPGIPAPFEPI